MPSSVPPDDAGNAWYGSIVVARRLPTDPTVVAPVAAAIVAAIAMMALGVVGIGRSFGYDEGYTYHFFINGGSVRRALTTQVVFNNHPTFSAVQAVAWRVGLVGETPQRLIPLFCASTAVGLVVWYTARRSTALGGLAAGILLGLNPIFLEQARQLRGYALATLAVVVAGLALDRSWSDQRRRWLVVQGVAMAVAVTTHAYSALALLMMAAAAVAIRRIRAAHLIAWCAAALLAMVVQIPLFDDIRANLGARGRLFRSDFPVLLGRALLGWEWPAVFVTGALVAIGTVAIGRRSARHGAAVSAGAGVLVVVVVMLWLVVRPIDLYFRFFIAVVPLLAHLAGRGVAVLPRPVAPVAAIAAGALLVPGAGDILRSDPTIRDGAAVADRARAAGYELCGRHVEPLYVYTPPFRGVDGIGDFESCEVFISVLRPSTEARQASRDHFGASANLGGSVVIWAEPDTLERLGLRD